MTAARDDGTADEIVAAIESVSGLRPTVPPGVDLPQWVPRLGPHSAVDLSPDTVEIRVTASLLPLPPLLDELAEAVAALLAPTRWAGARLRIVVTDLDPEAVSEGSSKS